MAEKDHHYRWSPFCHEENCCQYDLRSSSNTIELENSPKNSSNTHLNDHSCLKEGHCQPWVSCSTSDGVCNSNEQRNRNALYPPGNFSPFKTHNSLSRRQKRSAGNPEEEEREKQTYESPNFTRFRNDHECMRNNESRGDILSSQSLSHFDLENGNWEQYRNLLHKIWVQNSLDSSTLNSESSTIPTMSSEEGRLPFDLLSGKSDSVDREEKNDVNNTASEGSLKHVVNNSIINASKGNNMFSPLIEARETQPHPTAITKEIFNPQGEPRLTLFLSSKVSVDASHKSNSFTIPRICLLSDEGPKNDFELVSETIPNISTDQIMSHPSGNKSFPDSSEELSLQSSGAERSLRSTEMCFCQTEVNQLKQALEQAQHQICNMSLQIEEQSSHLRLLLYEKENLPKITNVHPSQMSYPVFPQGGCKPPHHMFTPTIGNRGYNGHPSLGRRASCQPYSSQSYPFPLLGCGDRLSQFDRSPSQRASQEGLHHDRNHADPQALVNLRDKIVALQVQNLELNIFLRREEQKRIEAEEAVQRERIYVKKLEENIQDLSSSRLVMDPSSYKQVADKYIATKKKPVRRTHTCNPYLTSSDLVCDASKNHKQSLNVQQSSSCPSSPLCSKLDMNMDSSLSDTSSLCEVFSSASPSYNVSPSLSPTFTDAHLSPPIYDSSPICSTSEETSKWKVEDSKRETTSLNPLEYEQLLESLESLDTRSSPT